MFAVLSGFMRVSKEAADWFYLSKFKLIFIFFIFYTVMFVCVRVCVYSEYGSHSHNPEAVTTFIYFAVKRFMYFFL